MHVQLLYLSKVFRVLAENLVSWVRLVTCFLHEILPTHEKMFAVGKSGPNATFNPVFLGLGWSWVGLVLGWEYVVFIEICVCFPTQQILVNRKHPIVTSIVLYSYI